MHIAAVTEVHNRLLPGLRMLHVSVLTELQQRQLTKFYFQVDAFQEGIQITAIF